MRGYRQREHTAPRRASLAVLAACLLSAGCSAAVGSATTPPSPAVTTSGSHVGSAPESASAPTTAATACGDPITDLPASTSIGLTAVAHRNAVTLTNTSADSVQLSADPELVLVDSAGRVTSNSANVLRSGGPRIDPGGSADATSRALLGACDSSTDSVPDGNYDAVWLITTARLSGQSEDLAQFVISGTVQVSVKDGIAVN